MALSDSMAAKPAYKIFINQHVPFLRTIYRVITYEYKAHVVQSYFSYLQTRIKLGILKLVHKQVIGICLTEHIGDIIANEPLTREIRKMHPEAMLVFLVKKQYKELVQYNPVIDKVVSIYCLGTWIRLKKKTNIPVYDLHFNGRVCGKCYKTLEKENINKDIDGSNYFNYGGLLKSVCIENHLNVEDDVPHLTIPEKYISSARRKINFTKYIVIHCQSNNEIKDWDNEKWRTLIEELSKSYKMPVVEVGTHSDLNLNSDLYHNYCGRLELLETASLIADAALFIGLDSGPAHIANAVGTPGVILLGEYFGMNNYNPFSGNYTKNTIAKLIHSADHVKNISVKDVFENAQNLLSRVQL